MNRYYKRMIAGAALTLFAGLAQAQYVWIDEKGLKQFSDRPPPTSIPDKNILKAPGMAPVSLVPVGEQAQDAAPVAQAPQAAPTVAERNIEYKKRVAEKAENEKKAGQAARQKAAKAEQCASARAYKAQLDSGVRIGTVDKNGERAFMGDAERAQNLAKAAKILAECH